MKKLLLIRHAKSCWSDPTVTDFHRKLNKRGKRDAAFMADKLAARQVRPDVVISSPAKRARKTARIMAERVGYAKSSIRYDEAIYSSSTLNLYGVLQGLGDSHNIVFFVGHNYAITELAEELTGQQLISIPTSGIVAMTCDIEKWQEIGPNYGNLLFFDYPKMYAELR